MHIDEIRKELTKEEFLKRFDGMWFVYKSDEYGCPRQIGLAEYHGFDCNHGNCNQCWLDSIENIDFKDEIKNGLYIERNEEKNGYFPFNIGDIVNKDCAIYIIEKGGEIRRCDLVYFNKENKLHFRTYNGCESISDGYKSNFYDDDKYIIEKLPTQFQESNQLQKSNDISQFSTSELLAELTRRATNGEI